MLNVSKAFKRELYNDNRQYQCSATITLTDNTVLNITNEHIMGTSGFNIDDAVSEDNSFTALGATIINSATLTLYNNDEIYSDYIFENAKVVLYIALEVPNGNSTVIERIKKGTFTVDYPTYNEASITLSLLDNMEQFDRPYSISNLSYPATIREIVQNLCTICDVTLGTVTIPHQDTIISTRPTDDAITCREVLGWCATIAGCFARCDVDGNLELKWFNTNILEDTSDDFDGGTFNPWTEGTTYSGGTFNPWTTGDTYDGTEFTTSMPYHYINQLYTQNIAVDDVVITGVRIFVKTESIDSNDDIKAYIAGTSDYCIDIEDNEFITEDNVNTILSWLGTQIVGLRFRPCSITQSSDPSIEAGDVAFLFDHKQNEYPILITRTNFSVGSPQAIVCGAESASRKSATRYSQATKTFVESRKELRHERNIYQAAIEDLQDEIENANGLYETQVVQPDSSIITYMHNKPLLADSDIRIMISTVGVTVTANGTAQSPTWYGLTVNGALLASVINTMSLFFNYAHGGTLTLGGDNNINGQITVYNASGSTVIGKWDKDGLSATGDLTLHKQDSSYTHYYMAFSEVDYPYMYNTAMEWNKKMGMKITGGSQGFWAIIPLETNQRYSSVKMYEVIASTNIYEKVFLLGDIEKTGSNRVFRRLQITPEKVTFESAMDGTYDTNDFGTGYLQITKNVLYFTTHRPFVSGSIARGLYIDGNGIKLDSNRDGGGALINAGTSSLNISGRANSSATGYDIYASASSFRYGSIESNGIITEVFYASKTILRWMGQTIASNSSSSKRYKHDIKLMQDEEFDPHRLLKLQAKQYIYNDGHPLQYADMKGKTLPGFIAEEVAEIYPSAVIHHPETGEIESWDERRIIPGMLSLIQEQHKKIEELEDRISRLEKLLLK